MKTESLHRKAKKAFSSVENISAEFTGVAAKYLIGNQFRDKLVSIVNRMSTKFTKQSIEA